VLLLGQRGHRITAVSLTLFGGSILISELPSLAFAFSIVILRLLRDETFGMDD
jgi:hypothetical protein